MLPILDYLCEISVSVESCDEKWMSLAISLKTEPMNCCEFIGIVPSITIASQVEETYYSFLQQESDNMMVSIIWKIARLTKKSICDICIEDFRISNINLDSADSYGIIPSFNCALSLLYGQTIFTSGSSNIFSSSLDKWKLNWIQIKRKSNT